MDTDIASQSAADFKATKRKRMSDVAMGEGPDEDGDLMLDNAAPPSSEERAVKQSRVRSPPPPDLTIPPPFSTTHSFFSTNGHISDAGNSNVNGNCNSTTPSSAFPSPFFTPGNGTSSASSHFAVNGINGSGMGNGIVHDDSGMAVDVAMDVQGGEASIERQNDQIAGTTDYFSQGPTARSESPFAVQPFTTSLHPPPPSVGLLQPVSTPGLEGDGRGIDSPGIPSENLGAVQGARNTHGPHCNSIPKLVLSEHPSANGERSMWSMCQSCGSCERVG